MSLLAQQYPLGTINPPTEAYSQSSATGRTALTNLELFISNVVGILTVVASLAFILYFMLGAVSWVTSGGDSGKVQKARDQMIQGILGLIVVVAAYGIIGLVGRILGLRILNPAQEIELIIPSP